MVGKLPEIERTWSCPNVCRQPVSGRALESNLASFRSSPSFPSYWPWLSWPPIAFCATKSKRTRRWPRWWKSGRRWSTGLWHWRCPQTWATSSALSSRCWPCKEIGSARIPFFQELSHTGAENWSDIRNFIIEKWSANYSRQASKCQIWPSCYRR